MRKEYDFTGATRGALIATKGKSRITIYIDDFVLDEFRARAEKSGTGYQTLINDALRHYLKGGRGEPVTEATLRRVIREELPKLSGKTTSARPDKSHAA